MYWVDTRGCAWRTKWEMGRLKEHCYVGKTTAKIYHRTQRVKSCHPCSLTLLAPAGHDIASSRQTLHAFSYEHWRMEVSGPTIKMKSLLSAFCITPCMFKHLTSVECLLAARVHATPSPDSWKLSHCGEHPQVWELQKPNRPKNDKCFHIQVIF